MARTFREVGLFEKCTIRMISKHRKISFTSKVSYFILTNQGTQFSKIVQIQNVMILWNRTRNASHLKDFYQKLKNWFRLFHSKVWDENFFRFFGNVITFSGALFEYEMIQMIFKTRFTNEGSGKNDFSRFQNNDPASNDYDPDWTIDDCVSHFAKRTTDREQDESERVRRGDDIYYVTRLTPKYQYKTSNRTSYYEKTNRTISTRTHESPAWLSAMQSAGLNNIQLICQKENPRIFRQWFNTYLKWPPKFKTELKRSCRLIENQKKLYQRNICSFCRGKFLGMRLFMGYLIWLIIYDS